MNLYGKIEKLRGLCGEQYWFSRIVAELVYLKNLSDTKGNAFDEDIEKVCDLISQKLSENGAITKTDVLEAENSLMKYSEVSKEIEVLCVSHAHIDMNWMWGYQETAGVTIDTFRTILNLMKEYPEFTYSQSQASTYKIVEDTCPEMLEEIKQRVHEGRWELSASTWVEADKNMPSGESLTRHILYTKKYLSKLFDIDPDSLRLDFEPDTFGHNINVPEICQNGGVDYYYHCRGKEGDEMLFRWRSPSGKELLTVTEMHWYNWDINAFFATDSPAWADKYKFNTILRVYGVGDHGGGPTRRDIERIIDMNTWPLMPRYTFSTYKEFFSRLETIRDTLPVIDKELNCVFTGCYTTQTRIKLSNRLGEERAYESEFLCTAANKLAGLAKKNDTFEIGWRNILFNHFHDILPGSGTIETREYAMGKFQETMSYFNINANSAMYAIASNIDTSFIPFEENKESRAEGAGVGYGNLPLYGYKMPQTDRGTGRVRAIHLFNSTMYEREEMVEVTIWDYNGDWENVVITDIDGNEVPFQIVEDGKWYWGHSFKRLLVSAKLPAFGYNTYVLKDTGCKKALKCEERLGPLTDEFGEYEYVLENNKIKAVFAPMTMLCTELTNKATGVSVFSKDNPSCAIRFIKETLRHGMSAWRISPYISIENLNESGKAKVIDYQKGALRSFLTYEMTFELSKVTVTVELKENSELLEFTIDADWHEIGTRETFVPQLNFFVPVSYDAKAYGYNIPYGEIEREDLAYDVPANSYMTVKGGDKNVMIVTDSKYGFRGNDNSGAVTLIRSSCDPDRYPELGFHKIKIGVGAVEKDAVRKTAECFVHPVCFTAGRKQKGNLPLKKSLFNIDGDVMTSAVKIAEDSLDVIVRVADVSGKDQTVNINGYEGVTKAYIVDANEKVIEECKVANGAVSVPVKANSIAAIKLVK